MNLLLFIVVLIVSWIVVRIGAIAFELTGLETSLANFQALSCFTSTGFTTKEAELITGHRQRRRIASILIILGHAGLVTLVATFANTLRTDSLISKFRIPFLHLVVPAYLVPLVNLLVALLSAYLIYKLFTYARFARKLTEFLRKRLKKKDIVKHINFEELLVATGGYGVAQFKICKDSHALNKTLRDSDLRSHDITILAIERGSKVMPNPAANTKILSGDTLICFGELGTLRNKLCDPPG